MGAVFDHKAWTGKSGGTYGSLAVGDITQLNVDGVATDFIVVHQGNPDGSLYDESCEGTWLLMEDIYEIDSWNDDYNIYAASNVKFDCGAFKSKLDSAVQAAIKSVKIPYVDGKGSSGSVASGANGLSAEVFLLSGYEVGFTTSNNQSFPVDGAKLDYFESGSGATVLAKRIAKFNGSNSAWWLRSPYKGNSTNAWQVQSSGQYGSRRVTTTGGIRPCLIMPANQKIFAESGGGSQTITDLLGTTWTWDTTAIETAEIETGGETEYYFEAEFQVNLPHDGMRLKSGIQAYMYLPVFPDGTIGTVNTLVYADYPDNGCYDILYENNGVAEWRDPPYYWDGNELDKYRYDDSLSDFLTITFTGGDTTNSDLIAFMQTYATRVS